MYVIQVRFLLTGEVHCRIWGDLYLELRLRLKQSHKCIFCIFIFNNAILLCTTEAARNMLKINIFKRSSEIVTYR